MVKSTVTCLSEWHPNKTISCGLLVQSKFEYGVLLSPGNVSALSFNVIPYVLHNFWREPIPASDIATGWPTEIGNVADDGQCEHLFGLSQYYARKHILPKARRRWPCG